MWRPTDFKRACKAGVTGGRCGYSSTRVASIDTTVAWSRSLVACSLSCAPRGYYTAHSRPVLTPTTRGHHSSLGAGGHRGVPQGLSWSVCVWCLVPHGLSWSASLRASFAQVGCLFCASGLRAPSFAPISCACFRSVCCSLSLCLLLSFALSVAFFRAILLPFSWPAQSLILSLHLFACAEKMC